MGYTYKTLTDRDASLFKHLTKNPEQVFEERHIRVGEYFVDVPHSRIHINFTPDLFDLFGQL